MTDSPSPRRAANTGARPMQKEPSFGDQASEAWSGATNAARDAYERGWEYADEYYPAARRRYRSAASTVGHYANENPVLLLVAGAALGLAVAWFARGRDNGRSRRRR